MHAPAIPTVGMRFLKLKAQGLLYHVRLRCVRACVQQPAIANFACANHRMVLGWAPLLLLLLRP